MIVGLWPESSPWSCQTRRAPMCQATTFSHTHRPGCGISAWSPDRSQMGIATRHTRVNWRRRGSKVWQCVMRCGKVLRGGIDRSSESLWTVGGGGWHIGRLLGDSRGRQGVSERRCTWCARSRMTARWSWLGRLSKSAESSGSDTC